MAISVEIRPNDPLLYGVPLPFREIYYPMGFPVVVTTNSRKVIRAADEVWGRCNNEFGCAPIEVRIAVDETSQAERPADVLPRAQGHLISLVHSAENFATADLARGFAFGWFTNAVAGDAGYFRYHFLEPLAYLILVSLYLTPVHAACIAVDGSGVLLCGESGAGKTSLAYACARHGWTYVSDDASYLIRPGTTRGITGKPNSIRFRGSAPELFPELADYPIMERANGKFDIEAQTSALGLNSIAMNSRADYVIFLNRRDTGSPRFRAVAREHAFERLNQALCFGEERVREEQRVSLRHLLNVPIFELFYRDLQDAERLLESLVRIGA